LEQNLNSITQNIKLHWDDPATTYFKKSILQKDIYSQPKFKRSNQNLTSN